MMKAAANQQAGVATPAAPAAEDRSVDNSAILPGRGLYTNKQRVLVIASRGITARYRHLLEDLKKLIPHHKKDNKLDTKGDIRSVNEIAEMKSCNQILYLECRKQMDLYMHISKAPHGPSIKFQVMNIHTMDELKLTGNCMIGSRPLLNFDSAFDTAPHLQLMKATLMDIFNTPAGHPKSKPFVDRVMSFYLVNNNIWVRNYQITEGTEKVGGNKTKLIEIGPRMVLVPIRIFNGSLGGVTLYQNPGYTSPNDERAMHKRLKGTRYGDRVNAKIERTMKEESLVLPPDELSNSNLFKTTAVADDEDGFAAFEE